MPENYLLAAKVDKGKKPPKEEPLPPLRKLTPEEASRFANWIPSYNTKEMATDLGRRGLLNASQLIEEVQPNLVTAATSKSVQSSWKPAAIVNILQKAREFGIRTPQELIANKDVLMQKEYKDAINHPEFKRIHPNFWNVVGELYKERLQKESSK